MRSVGWQRKYSVLLRLADLQLGRLHLHAGAGLAFRRQAEGLRIERIGDVGLGFRRAVGLRAVGRRAVGRVVGPPCVGLRAVGLRAVGRAVGRCAVGRAVGLRAVGRCAVGLRAVGPRIAARLGVVLWAESFHVSFFADGFPLSSAVDD